MMEENWAKEDKVNNEDNEEDKVENEDKEEDEVVANEEEEEVIVRPTTMTQEAIYQLKAVEVANILEQMKEGMTSLMLNFHVFIKLGIFLGNAKILLQVV